jgi:hypothetical protein
MLRSCLYDDIPAPFDQDHHYETVYERVLEIQAEQCDAIYLLYENGLFRPAFAVLRSILEAMATLIWVSLDIGRNCALFEKRKQPNMKEILNRVGWKEEYDRTFRYLCGFVHIDMTNADFYRSYEAGDDPSQPFPEVLPDAEYYIVGTEEGLSPLSIRVMSVDESEAEYGPYLTAKTFDFVAAGLQSLYGDDYYKRGWWPREAAVMCEQLTVDYPDIAKQMLWSLQKNLFDSL